MSEKKGKILGTIVFLLLILCILFLTFFPVKKNNEGELKMVEITGNSLLSENDYLTFTRLDEQSVLSRISLPVIKDRIEKHPYVDKADVEADGIVAKVVLSEKLLEASLIIKGEPYFVSDEFQLLPVNFKTPVVLSGEKFNVPLITNASGVSDADALSFIKSEDVKEAFKIIEAAKKVNKNIFKHLSEINLHNGGDIELFFTGIPPVKFGRGEEAKKMVYLNIMWEGLTGGDTPIQQSDYIDLRFAGEVYIGKNDIL